MSMYHSGELAYLAQVYTNLLITKQPLDLYFRPQPNGFKDRVLHVQPDILPPGRTCVSQVWIDGQEYKDFDPGRFTVKLPDSNDDLRVRVRIVPNA